MVEYLTTHLNVGQDTYNNERPHMSLEWKTPAEAALCTGELKKKSLEHLSN